MSYSDLLAAITPDAAVRREYLASFFEGKEPGPTHEALAAIADRGLVRVFVTTNFDRLLEHALQARGIEPVVIGSDADLEAAMPREHASCVVLKPHGDYLRETIRNTPEELAELDPAVTAELGEVFSRYGIVVLGYSGADEGIALALRGRRSRFGVWWVVRGELGQPAAELVDAISARVVRRDSAVEFLADLERRLAVFEEHPSGLTPAATHDGVLAMLRAGDGVGLDDTLRRERHDYESEVDRLTADALARYGTLTEDDFHKAWSALRPVLERRLASLLPLALHAPERFAGEVEHTARSLERRPQRGGLTLWIELPEFAAAWLGYVCGGLLVRLDQYDALRPLLETTWTDANGRARPLIQFAGETSHGFGGALAPTGQRWLAPGWEFLTRSLGSADWLRERYPELFADGEPRAGLSQFDVLVCIHHATHDQSAVAFFALDRASIAFALRARREPAASRTAGRRGWPVTRGVRRAGTAGLAGRRPLPRGLHDPRGDRIGARSGFGGLTSQAIQRHALGRRGVTEPRVLTRTCSDARSRVLLRGTRSGAGEPRAAPGLPQRDSAALVGGAAGATVETRPLR